MAGSVNKVILVGNLGRDPEVRHTQDGTKIVHLSVATSERWRDRSSGENRERTEWHRVVIFNERLGEVAEKYLPRAARCISRASCRHASGPTSRARSATPPRSCCSAFAASSPCWAAAATTPASAAARLGHDESRRARGSGGGGGGGGGRKWSGYDDLDDEIPF